MAEKRLTLFLTEEVRELLTELSTEYGVPKSQLVAYFVLTGVSNAAQAGARLPGYLVPSESPVWQHNIDLERVKKDLGLG